jgi:hypothetical protein
MMIDLTRLRGEHVDAQWYDSRQGHYSPIGTYARQPTSFTPPADGPDWVLVLGRVNEYGAEYSA